MLFWLSINFSYGQNCRASFLFSTQQHIVGFTNNSSGLNLNSMQTYWNFGDSQYSTLTHPYHAYSKPGKYLVTMFVNDGQCSDIYRDSIEIISAPSGCKASFMALISYDTVQFINLSTGINSNSSFFWSFGDGKSSALQDPVYKYKKGGKKNVWLKINSGSCLDSTEQVLQIIPAQSCYANFSYKIYTDSVYFQTDSPNLNCVYYWTFGDNGTSAQAMPLHIYSKNGIYTVSLNLTDTSTGSKDFFTDTISMSSIPCAMADFSYYMSGDTICFINKSTGDLKIFSWLLGDGKESNKKNPKHLYSGYGDYKVTLFVSDSSFSCTDQIEKTIHLSAPTFRYNVSGKVICTGFTPDYATVLLIQTDSLSRDVIKIDTLQLLPTDSGKYNFSNIPRGYYTIKAFLNSLSTAFNQYIPAYFTGELLWKDISAMFIEFNLENAYINLPPAKYNSTLGCVSGITYIQEDSSKGISKSISSGKTVLLLDASLTPLSSSLSDSMGQFSCALNNLGIFQLYMDVPGKISSPWQFETLSPTEKIKGVQLYENEKYTYAMYQNTGLLPQPNYNPVKVYPNPAHLENNMCFDKVSQVSTIRFYTLNGQFVLSQEISSNNCISIPSSLHTGTYIIQITYSSGLSNYTKWVVLP